MVDDITVASLASSELSNADYVQTTTAVANATEEKIEEITKDETAKNQEDNVSGRQSIITNRFQQIAVTQDDLNYFYNLPTIKNLINDGYTLVSNTCANVNSRYNNVATASVHLELYKDGYANYRFVTPTGIVIFYNNNYRQTITYKFSTLATNEKTGEKN